MTTHESGHYAQARITIAAISTAVTILLGGCGLIMGENLDGLKITVTNNTDNALIVRQGNSAENLVGAGVTAVVELARVECTAGANAITEDGDQATKYPGELCEGDSWVIEQGDLMPYREVFPLRVAVTNYTGEAVTIHAGGVLRGSIHAGGTVTIEFWGVECADDASAVTEDGSSVALYPGALCEGDKWVIRSGDLNLVPRP